MKKRVLCINPPVPEGDAKFTREGRCNGEEDAFSITYPPVTLASIAGHIRSKGHEVKLVDCIGSKISWSDFEQEIISFKPQIAIVNTAIPTIKNDLGSCDLIKKHFKKCIVAAYGLFPSVNLKEAKKIQPKMDFWIIGEPETPALKITEGKKIKESLWLEPNLDALAMPAYDLLPEYKYPMTNEKWMFLIDGRGCPYRCTYCVESSMSKGNARYKSAERVVSEIEYVVNELGTKVVMFWDDLFTFDRKRAVGICELIIKKGLHKKFGWLATTRVDRVDQELLILMKKAGCKLLAFGIESSNQEVLNKARKGTTVEQARAAVKAAKKAGLGTMGHFIIGLPGSSRKIEEENIAFSKSIGLDFAQFYCCTAFPGSELYETALKEKWIRADGWKSIRQSAATISYPDFSAEEINSLRKKAYLSFYLRPNTFFAVFRQLSFSGAIHILPKGLKFLKWTRR